MPANEKAGTHRTREVSRSYRSRVPKLSLTYRSHGVKHEPELHNSFRSIARTTRANSKSLVCPEASQMASELGFCGRDGEIRTPDPLLPKQVRYQAAPHPDGL